MSPKIEAVLPFWLVRPDNEALDIALEARAVGLDTLWTGENELLDHICASGSQEDVAGRISA